MAAETLAQGGVGVDVYDAMPSVGRKFLLAGIGGLNLTHSEALPRFRSRYGAHESQVGNWLDDFGPDAVRGWADQLGVATFVGSSGRVFPRDMKAAPLLRAWLHQLRGDGVRFHMRHRWTGWDEAGDGPTPSLRLATPAGERRMQARALVLALGGASWPRLGSDGAWFPLLGERGVALAPLQPANCGFDVAAPRACTEGGHASGWSALFRNRAAGQPMKTVAIMYTGVDGTRQHQRGEFVFTETGVEGSLIYALSADLRDAIAQAGRVQIELDLLPDRSAEWVRAEVGVARGSRSLSSHLRSRLHIDALKMLLLHELLEPETLANPGALASAIKALPLTLSAPRPLAEAISTAGGVRLDALDQRLMLHAVHGVFCAGEMLDWEAPTGGYLLTAALASGRRAGEGVLAWLRSTGGRPMRS